MSRQIASPAARVLCAAALPGCGRRPGAGAARPSHRDRGQPDLRRRAARRPGARRSACSATSSRAAPPSSTGPRDGSMLVADALRRHRAGAPGGGPAAACASSSLSSASPIEWARARAQSGPGFVFCKDQGGDDNAQVYYQSGQRRGARSSPTGLHPRQPVWAHDGKRVAFYGNDRDTRELRHLCRGRELGAPRRSSWSGASRTPGIRSTGRRMTPSCWCGSTSSLSESYLYLADVATGALTPLEDKPQQGRHPRRARFAPDGAGCTCSPTRTASSRS